MPKNNIHEHIQWLLSNKPFIPSADSLSGYDPTTAESNPASGIESTQDHALIPATVRAVTQPTPPPSSCHETDPADIGHKALNRGDIGTEMARLRVTPGGGKAKLVLTAATTYDTHTRAGTSPLIRTVEHIGNRSMERGQQPTFNSTSGRKAVSNRTHIDSFDIESIDLTDSTSYAGSSSQRIKKGKKRKSDDFEQGSRVTKSPRPGRTIPATSPDQFDADFPDIDELIHAADDPPPPYSTMVVTSQAAVSAAQEEDLHHNRRAPSWVNEFEEETAMQDVAQEGPESGRKRKSISRAPSEITAPPRKIGKQARSPSPKKIPESPLPLSSRPINRLTTPPQQRKIRKEVLDSEDDGSDEFQDSEEESRLLSFTPTISCHPTKHLPNRTITKRTTQRAESPKVLIIRSPSKSLTSTSPKRTVQDLVSHPMETQDAMLKRMSPKKTRTCPETHAANLDSVPSSSGATKEQRDSVRKIVEKFLAAEGERLPQLLKTAIDELQEARDAAFRFIEEYGTEQPEDNERVNKIKSRRDALEELVALYNEHQRLVKQRLRLRKKMERDQDAQGHCNPADSASFHQIFKSLEDIQGQIFSLIETAGMMQYLGNQMREGNEIDIVIKSTQPVTITKTRDVPVYSGSGHVPQTQYVKQAQASASEVWTPSRHIRFANQPDTLSVPRSPDLHSGRQVHPTSNVGIIRPQNQTPRIPESPQRRRSPGASEINISDDTSNYSDEFDEDENLFMYNMGEPPVPLDQDEDFCDDDDDDFLELVNIDDRGVDWKGERVGSASASRVDMREASTNPDSHKKQKTSPRKSQLCLPGMDHPWSMDVREELLGRFGLKGFRPGQMEAVNTTLSGEHCFVLMPTGGGKSLCYQLPSVVTSGKTRGVTIVVSPLLSLMEDQVQACQTRFKMQAYLINGQSSSDERSHILNGLCGPDPQKFCQLLYITPEMLSMNQRMTTVLNQLYKRKELARIVIDEAHCVSQWGHDFRPDYKALGEVMRRFSGVPVMALTATATQLVQMDVMANLGINGCKKFSQSFNRPNLRYEVLPKGKNVVGSIAELIKSNYRGESGIVYCLARKTCEKVAEQLTALGVKSYHYHAGMDSKQRSQVQKKWQNNVYRVIVATIAFGMGIDKADVRFVVHHSLPKSLEGYYQETGRAGRDGKFSECYLYYLYSDCRTLKKFIKDSDGSREQKHRQYEMLRKVIQFCENKSDCRRAQVLGYFSETFEAKDCKQTCDNCDSDLKFVERDLTKYAVKAVFLVSKVEEDAVTLLQCVDAFRGAKTSKLKRPDLKESFGYGADLERGDVERLFQKMIEQGAIYEASKKNRGGFVINYVKVGSRSKDYETNRQKLVLQVRDPSQKLVSDVNTMEKTTRPAYPSTNISSPVRRKTKKAIQQYAYHEDNDDAALEDITPSRSKTRKKRAVNSFIVDDDDYNDPDPFANEHVSTRKGKGKAVRDDLRKPLGRPITIDARIAGLNETEKAILDDFVEGAKSMSQDILLKKNLKRQPFSDTILREMALVLPRTKEELLKIPNIDPEMVRHYAKDFLPLIRNTREAHGLDEPVERPKSIRRHRVVEDDDEPLDPNHQVVIDLCSSDVEAPQYEGESVASFEEDEDDESFEVSHHFVPTETDPRVETFNRQAIGGASKASSTGRKLPWKQKSYPRKSSTGPSRTGRGGGVTKRSAPKKTGARKSSGAIGGAQRTAGGGGSRRGGDAWSSILAMPT